MDGRKDNGGKREGAGRKAKADEQLVRNIAESAIAKKYGSLEKGFLALLESGESALIKFVFEHAAGKPKESHEHGGIGGGPIIAKHVVEFRNYADESD